MGQQQQNWNQNQWKRNGNMNRNGFNGYNEYQNQNGFKPQSNAQAAQPQAVNGRYQTFGIFDGSVLRIWIKNLNDVSVVYKNDFDQSSFPKLKIDYVAKQFIDYLQTKKPVKLSQSGGDIHLSIPSSDLPSFALKLEDKSKKNKYVKKNGEFNL